MEHREFEEGLELEFDGELGAERRARLQDHLRSCPRCQAQSAELAKLRALLDRSAVAVRPDFRSAVMSALPAAGWETRNPRTWAVPLALVAVLGGAAAVLMGVSAARLEPGGPFLGALQALAAMLGSTALAGGGLLAASWRGVGLAVSALADRSPLALGVFGLGVLCLNLLLWRLLRDRRPAAEWGRRERR